MVVAGSQIPPGGEPHAPTNPPGPIPVQGTRLAGPSSSSYRGPNPIHPDRQQQPNVPFFYVQPMQPSLPYQWPMPICYVPYGGFSGFGYGMVLPPFPPASYADAPGYILPHSQMHMVDYRRMMTPHSAPTMAYQARRYRFQHTTPSSRVMVSCEVQTDSSLHSGDDAPSSQPTSESGRSSGPGSILSSPNPSEERPAHLESPMSSSNKAEVGSSETTNPGILFQAEEVRIECRGSPTGLKIIHSKEIAELARNSTGELLQCNMGSAEDLVLRCFQPVPYTEDEQREPMEVMSQMHEPYLPPCPDILMMRSCPSNSTTLEGTDVTAVDPTSRALVVQGDPSIVRSNEDSMQHSLELQCLDELPLIEASVWSVESLLPYVPSPGWMAKNGLVTPQKLPLPTVREVPAEIALDSTQSLMPSSQEKQVRPMIEFDGPDSTRPESRPSSCPSSSQLADVGDPGCGKPFKVIRNRGSSPEGLLMGKAEVSPDTEVQTSSSPHSAPEKLDKEQTNHRTKMSGVNRSDQDGSSPRLCPALSLKHKERFCRSCIIKLRAGMAFGSPSLKGSGTKRHRVAHPHKSKVQLCNMCMHDPEKTKSGNAGSMKMDQEISENAVYLATGPKKCPKRLFNIQNVPSGRHAEKCPMSHQSKLREQNCLCEHPKVSHCNLAWNSNDTRERNEENLSSAERWRDGERLISQQSDRSWRGVVSETESIKSGGKMTPKKQTHCAPTPEIHRKDTRC